jgi:putative membrane protein
MMQKLQLLPFEVPPVEYAQDMQSMPYGWHMHDWAFEWGSAHMFLMVVFWIAVIFGVVLVIQNLSGLDRRVSRGRRALGVLDERYAKGEIDREEYLRRRQDIKGA